MRGYLVDQPKPESGTSLTELLRGGSFLRDDRPLDSSTSKTQEIEVVDFTFALLLNEQRDPVCVGFPLEGLDGDVQAAAHSATQAEISAGDLVLHGPKKTLKLLNVQPAISAALDSALALVVFDKLRGIERVIPL